MKIGFQMDHISGLNFKTDSTLPIIYESQKRKNINYIFHPSDLTHKNNKLFVYANSIKILSSNFKRYKLGAKKKLLLDYLKDMMVFLWSFLNFLTIYYYLENHNSEYFHHLW